MYETLFCGELAQLTLQSATQFTTKYATFEFATKLWK
jgi:hypothetical protein